MLMEAQTSWETRTQPVVVAPGDPLAVESNAFDLIRFGVCVVNTGMSPQMLSEQMKIVRKSFPEYKEEFKAKIGTIGEERMVLGGFGALANPSSFHHPFVRYLRRQAKTIVATLAAASFPTQKIRSGLYMQELFDRIGVRKKDFGTISAEAWHRDVYNGANRRDDDIILGGWINCDVEYIQKFNCILATNRTNVFKNTEHETLHRELYDQELMDTIDLVDEGGFALLQNATMIAKLMQKRRSIEVPPGHMVVFFQDILHEVVSTKQPDLPTVRLYTGHCFRTVDEPLIDYTDAIAKQGVPPLPSGQMPPLFSTNHYQWFKKPGYYRDWDPFVPEIPRIVDKYSGHIPVLKDVGERVMYSLEEYGLQKYVDYTADDVAVVSMEPFGVAINREFQPWVPHGDVEMAG